MGRSDMRDNNIMNTAMNKIDTIIFDLDGTLLYTLDDLLCSVNYALEKHHYPLRTIKEIRCFVGNGVRLLMRRALGMEKIGTIGECDNPLRVIDDEEFEAIFADFTSHYLQHCNDRTRPYDGIMNLLKELYENQYKMAIVSNKADPAVKELNEIYFKDYIKVAKGENESRGIGKKPAPDMVFAALEELESDIEHAIYVGDSEVDIATANNSNLGIVVCTWGFRDEDFLKEKGARLLISKPMELIDVLK